MRYGRFSVSLSLSQNTADDQQRHAVYLPHEEGSMWLHGTADELRDFARNMAEQIDAQVADDLRKKAERERLEAERAEQTPW